MSKASSMPDPFRLWREWADQAEKQLSSNINAMAAAGQLGAASQQVLEAHTAYQAAMREAAERYLAPAHLHTGNTGTAGSAAWGLGQRLDAIEARLSALEAVKNTAHDPVQLWQEWSGQAENQLRANLQEMISGEPANAAARQVLDVFTTYQTSMREAAERFFSSPGNSNSPDPGENDEDTDEGVGERFEERLDERLGAIEAQLASIQDNGRRKR